MPHLSAKKRKWRLKFAHVHQSCRVKDWNNIFLSGESGFLLRLLDEFGVNNIKTIHPYCFVLPVYAGGSRVVMVLGVSNKLSKCSL